METTKQEKWNLSIFDQDKIKALSEELKIKPMLTKILLSKNLDTSTDALKKFITPDPKLITDTHQLSTQTDIQTACKRIETAIRKKEKIIINGDPDADGISGTTIYSAAFEYLGIATDFDFPIRATEGHGLQIRIIDNAIRENVTLIITTDCGSKDYEAINYAKQKGVDVIITDHHVLGKEKNPAFALINPFTIQEKTLFQGLSGGGVAFKFILCLFNYLKKDVPQHLHDFMLIIVTFGTISDRMSLLNPMNRIIIKEGIEKLKETKKEGLKAIMKVSFDRNQDINARNLSRTVVPRLNAPGRIGNPEQGILDSKTVVSLLLTGQGKKNEEKANELIENMGGFKKASQKNNKSLNTAASIDNINEKRKFITSKIEEEIDKLIKIQVDPQKDKIIIIQGKDWNSGVIGIDTDRLKERFLKPAIILTELSGQDYLKASVRSIPNINIYKILEKAEEKFKEKYKEPIFCMEVKTEKGFQKVSAFGGHSQACGFSIHKNHIPILKKLLNKEMEKLDEKDFSYTYNIIDKISLAHIGPKLYENLNELAPYGQNFEFPIYYSQSCNISGGKVFGNRYQDSKKPHVRFVVSQKSRRLKKTIAEFKTVGFGLSEKFFNLKSAQSPNERFDVIFFIEKETHPRNKQSQIILNVLDIRKSGKTVDSFNRQTDEIDDDLSEVPPS
ncbi:MAG: DHH family phosphoesterase [bacterium]